MIRFPGRSSDSFNHFAATFGAVQSLAAILVENDEVRMVNIQDQVAGVEPTAAGNTPHVRGLCSSPGPRRGRTGPRPAAGSPPGWMARLFGWIAGNESPARTNENVRDASSELCEERGRRARDSAGRTARDDMRGMTKQLLNDDRYAFVLLKAAADQINDADTRPAWGLLRQQMALVPAGCVPLTLHDGSHANAEVRGFFLDRLAVTNRQFRRFIQAGGYDSLEIWPQEVWPSVTRFTDRKGRPGPRDWEGGTFPSGKADHPVVGVSWYEAMAYARWVGKRLPTAAEWQKAGGWPEQLSGGDCSRYPWGDLFDPGRTNLWASGIGGTVPATEFSKGATPNGIFQMTGNVWEWLDDPLEAIPCSAEETFVPWKPMRRIIGGAFNTYFASEATCQFITGQAELDRTENIGFRCALSLEQLRALP
jgi:iron(II)-dependent oxidoreductase